MGMSVAGMGSGLDIDGMVTKLMAIERQPITKLDNQEIKAQSQISEWGKIKNALSDFQSTVQGLESSSNFNAIKGTSSDSSVASITSGTASTLGSTSIEVTQLAKASKVMLGGLYASESTNVNSGGSASTLSISFGTTDSTKMGTAGAWTGTTATKTVSIPANATLAQARDAINASGAGVTARTVNTGSGFRLVLESKNTGASNQLRVFRSGNLDAKFAYDSNHPMALTNELIRAQDAKYKVDSIPLTSASNTITTALTGSTVTLLKEPAAGATSGLTTTLSVTKSSSGVQDQLDGFVKAFNDLNSVLRSASAFGASPGRGQAPVGGGVLSGDPTVRAIQMDLRSMINQTIPGAPSGYASLSQIGMEFKKDGTLQLNTTKVTAALTANPDAVRSLLTGKANFTQATGFTHMSSNSLTKAGTYGVEITSMPSKAVLNGGTITAGGPDISGLSAANRAMSLNIDGQVINITLAPNAYSTYNFFSQGLQADINAQLPADKQITVAYNGGSNRFEFASSKTGAGSKVQIISSGAGLSVFGLAPATATGTGLAGKIGGAVALADDASMTLIGASGNGSAGLKIKVDATQTVGLHGSVSFATGVAYNLDKRVEGLVKSNGAVDSRRAGIKAQIKMIDDRREVLNRRMTMIESTMRKQFNAMDASVAKYTALNSYVAQQMTALAKSSGLA